MAVAAAALAPVSKPPSVVDQAALGPAPGGAAEAPATESAALTAQPRAEPEQGANVQPLEVGAVASDGVPVYPEVPRSVRIQRVHFESCGENGYKAFKACKGPLASCWKALKPLLNQAAGFIPLVGSYCGGPVVSCLGASGSLLAEPCAQAVCYGGAKPAETYVVEPIPFWEETKESRDIPVSAGIEGNRFVVREVRTNCQRMANSGSNDMDLYLGDNVIVSARPLKKCCFECGVNYGTAADDGKSVPDPFVTQVTFNKNQRRQGGACCADTPISMSGGPTLTRLKGVPTEELGTKDGYLAMTLNVMLPSACGGKRGNSGCGQKQVTLFPAKRSDQGGVLDFTPQGQCGGPGICAKGQQFDEFDAYGVDKQQFLAYAAGRLNPDSKVAPNAFSFPEPVVASWADKIVRVVGDEWHLHFPEGSKNSDRVALIMWAAQQMQTS